MADHERGAYTPPTADGPLTFDARQPVRGARPAPVTLILSILVLAGLVAAIFVFYRQGVRQAGQAPQAVGTEIAGMKSAAPPEAQPQDPAAGLQIYKEGAGEPMETVPPPPTFTAPPEQPQPRPAPVQVAVAPPAAPPAQTAIRPVLPAAPPAAKAPAPIAKAPPPPAPKAAPPPETKTAAAPAPKSTGGAAVQIGAVGSPALADKAWSEAVAAAPGLAAGKGKSVEKVERDGATLYRTAVTGFASREQAAEFCNRLKAAGKACFVR